MVLIRIGPIPYYYILMCLTWSSTSWLSTKYGLQTCSGTILSSNLLIDIVSLQVVGGS